jgi:ABC-type phosphate/phosphonate transport system substrate-binding protein
MLRLGAVAYDPKVVTIWEGFREFFTARGLPFDFVLYSNYERQVDALIDGHIDVAWNSPLAWIQSERRARERGGRAVALAMRDTDRDLTSLVVTRADSPIGRLADLRGRGIAVGDVDSPQATLIPLLHVAEAGLDPGRDVEVLRHEVAPGKHGDHVGGERDAVRALLAGRADAACLLDANMLAFAREGTLPVGTVRVLFQTPPYDHCNFTAIDPTPAVDRFVTELLAMSYEDATVRPLMDMEGLKAWRPGRVERYAQLARAVERMGG